MKALFGKRTRNAFVILAACTLIPAGSALAMPSYDIYENGGSGSINSTVYGGQLVEGATLELSCQPAEGYYFIEWQADGAEVQNGLSATGATLTLPDAHVGITANFGEMAAPAFVTDPQRRDYTGSPVAYEPSVTEDNGLDWGQVSVEYSKDYNGVYTAEPPVDAGEYHVRISYPGDGRHLPATVDSMLVVSPTVLRAKEAIIFRVEKNSVQFFTEANQLYTILPKGYAPPSKSSGQWMTGTGFRYEWKGLETGTDYIIYTYAQGTVNSEETRLEITGFNTPHEFAWDVKAVSNGQQLEDVTYELDEGYEQPEPVELKLTNTGTGRLDNMRIFVLGDADMFTVESDTADGRLYSGQTKTYKVAPIEDAPVGEYRADILIRATGHELGYNDTLESNWVHIKYKVDPDMGEIGEPAIQIISQTSETAPTEPPADYEKPSIKPQAGEAKRVVEVAIANTEPPVLNAITVSDVPASKPKVADLVDKSLVASLKGNITAASDDSYYYRKDDEEPKAAASTGSDSGESGEGSSLADEYKPLLENQDDGESQRLADDVNRKATARKTSSILWFYGIVVLAAVIFGSAVYWADRKLRRKTYRKRKPQRPMEKPLPEPDLG